MKTNYVNYICFALLITLFTAVVASIPQAIKAKQTISNGIQASTNTYTDVDAIDYGNECRYTTCTVTSDEVDNPFK